MNHVEIKQNRRKKDNPSSIIHQSVQCSTSNLATWRKASRSSDQILFAYVAYKTILFDSSPHQSYLPKAMEAISVMERCKLCY